MPNTFFTADTHFNHGNIIKYCKRPFTTTWEMNEAIIANWNAVVRPDDTVYHLGDFAFYKKGDYTKILSKLNGNIHLVIGNHDRGPILKDPRFKSVKPLDTIVVNNQTIVVCHYAMRTWNKSHWGAWQLYGHSHGTLTDLPGVLATDVGVDRRGFTPVHFDTLRLEMLVKEDERKAMHHG